MLDSHEIATLLGAARAEAEGRGQAEAGIVHLAIALMKAWPHDAPGIFGLSRPEDLEGLLAPGMVSGTESEVLALLSSGNPRTTILTTISERISSRAAASQAAQGQATPRAASPTGGTGPGPRAKRPLPPWHQPFSEWFSPLEPRDDLLERSAELDEVVAQLRRQQPPAVLVTGDPGTGRSAFLAGLAGRLQADRDPRQVHLLSVRQRVDAPTLLTILASAPADAVIAIDDAESLMWLDSDSPVLELVGSLASGIQRTDAGVVLTMQRRVVSKLQILLPDVVADMATVPLPPLSPAAVAQVVEAEAARLREVHGVRADAALLTAVGSSPLTTDALQHPALACRRLDAAMARAAGAGERIATPANVIAKGAPTGVSEAFATLAIALGQRIRGQEEAIDAVTRRLALTRTGLDLRPERPNGVFLFVGPTGVGKTELAREIARSFLGGEDRLLRLDMSEYSDEWAVSRLTGPMPGYIGSTDPQSWLTTRVAAMPECVVLLDEIEKADPTVWNTFLQVFDAGRLTDSRGMTADFRQTVVIMTSNLGAKEASAAPVGFGGEGSTDRSRAMLMSVVRERLPPELLNRMDEIAVFRTLTPQAIVEIATDEFARACARLTAEGWELEVADGVVEWLATTGYDPGFGARHLQRNIEREFLSVVAGTDSRTLSVDVDTDRLRIEPIPGRVRRRHARSGNAQPPSPGRDQ